MAEEKMKKHKDEDCDEEECVAVKGCRKGRPVKVRLEEDCDPIPVSIEQKHCEPLAVKLKQEHCDPLQVHIKGRPHVHQAEGDCWHVQGCKDGEPVNVNIVNQPPPAVVDNHQFVFDGVSWVPELTPSRFIPLDNVIITGSGTVWTPAAGLKFRLMGYFLTSSLAGQVDFRDGIGGPIIASQVVVAGVPFSPPPLGNGILSAFPNNPLVITVSAGPGPSAAINGLITGQETV